MMRDLTVYVTGGRAIVRLPRQLTAVRNSMPMTRISLWTGYGTQWYRPTPTDGPLSGADVPDKAIIGD
jgi:hypothetical protein